MTFNMIKAGIDSGLLAFTQSDVNPMMIKRHSFKNMAFPLPELILKLNLNKVVDYILKN